MFFLKYRLLLIYTALLYLGACTGNTSENKSTSADTTQKSIQTIDNSKTTVHGDSLKPPVDVNHVAIIVHDPCVVFFGYRVSGYPEGSDTEEYNEFRSAAVKASARIKEHGAEVVLTEESVVVFQSRSGKIHNIHKKNLPAFGMILFDGKNEPEIYDTVMTEEEYVQLAKSLLK